MNQRDLRLTVLLFVPGDRPERYAKALASGADATIVDLEDAVAPGAKPVARHAARLSFAAGLDAYVRINPSNTAEGREDIKALAGLRLRGVLLPKVDTQFSVRTVGLTSPIIALIETTRGLLNVHDIAADESVIALAFGAFDLCAELGAQPTPEVLQPYRSTIVMAARLAGKGAIDAPFLDIDDEAGLRADARRAVESGFDGKLAIHPKQVATIREAFTPSEAELAHAHAVLKAVERGGVAVVNGKMVDPPIVASAQRTVARAASREPAP
jgi:citrate lyase subunit beta/citryl-CoA lyase